MNSVDWSGDWNGLWTGLLEYWTGLLEHWTGLRMRKYLGAWVLLYCGSSYCGLSVQCMLEAKLGALV